MSLHAQWTGGRLQFVNGVSTAIGAAGIDFGPVNSSAFLHGGGSSSYPLTIATEGKFMSYYLRNSSVGDNRGLYIRLYLSGVAASGESARLYTTVEAAGATSRGAHISLDFGTSGSLSGLGAACDSTLHIPDRALTGGTYTAFSADIYSDGASSTPAAVTELSFLRFANSGDATGAAAVDDKAFLFSLDGGSIASGNLICAKSAAAVSHVARVNIYGTPYYVMLSNAI